MSPRQFWLWGSAALLILTSVAYCGVFHNGFVDFDDNIYVTSNKVTEAGLSPAGFYYAWTTFDSGNWIPITWLSYQLDVTLFGRDAWGFHLTDLTLHGLNVLLLFGWLIRVTSSRWRSLIVAGVFAVHPLHVESVAWVAERKDVLSAFWLLVALLAYSQYVARPTLVRYLTSCIAFALGLMSKSMLVTFPMLLLLIDVWPLKRLSAVPGQMKPLAKTIRYSVLSLVIEKIPLFILSLLDGFTTIVAQRTGHAVGDQMAGTSFTLLPLWIRSGNALRGYAWYVLKTIWPSELCVYYPHPLNDLDLFRTTISFAFLAGISIYVAINGRSRPHLAFGWIWFLISLLPVIGLIQVGSQAYADRYSYIPHFGLLVLIVWESHYWLTKRFPPPEALNGNAHAISQRVPNEQSNTITTSGAPSSGIDNSKTRFELIRTIAIVVTMATMTGLCKVTVAQVATWQTTDSLWNQALKVDSENWFAHLQVGNRRVTTGQTDDRTLQHFQTVLKYRPRHSIALNNAGWIYQNREEWSKAEEFYRRAIQADKGFALAVHNLVALLKKQNRLEDGLDLMTIYAARNPGDGHIQNELGLIDVRRGQFEQALDHFERAVMAAPDFANARYNLALTLINLGNDRAARSHLETLLKLYPHHANSRLNLGILQEKAGQLAEARANYAAALQENSADAEARDRLERISKCLGQP